MAKKKKTKSSSPSGGSNSFASSVRLTAFIALAAAAISQILIFANRLVKLIVPGFSAFNAVNGIFEIVREVALIIAVVLAAWGFVANKRRAWKVAYWFFVGALIVIYVLTRILVAAGVF